MKSLHSCLTLSLPGSSVHVILQERIYWSGLPCPSPRDFPDPGTELTSPVTIKSQVNSLPLSHRGSPLLCVCVCVCCSVMPNSLPFCVCVCVCVAQSCPILCPCVCVCVCVCCSVMPNSLQPHGLQPTTFLWLWDFPGKNAGVLCYFLLYLLCLVSSIFLFSLRIFMLILFP